MVNKFSAVPTKIPPSFSFAESDKLKFYFYGNLEKNKFGGLTVSNFKIYIRAIKSRHYGTMISVHI